MLLIYTLLTLAVYLFFSFGVIFVWEFVLHGSKSNTAKQQPQVIKKSGQTFKA
jgi:hypothetical protein